MKKVLELLTQFRNILTSIEGNLIPVSFDVSIASYEYDGVSYHCVIWYKTDADGNLYESAQTYLSSAQVDKRWAFHEGFKDELATLRTTMTKPIVVEETEPVVVEKKG